MCCLTLVCLITMMSLSLQFGVSHESFHFHFFCLHCLHMSPLRVSGLKRAKDYKSSENNDKLDSLFNTVVYFTTVFCFILHLITYKNIYDMIYYDII